MSLCAMFNTLKIISQRNNVRLKLISVYYQQRCLSSKQPKHYIVKEIDPNTGEERRLKSRIVPKITLMSGDDMSVTTLEEAQHISKRRDLKLVKVVDLDSKTQRPVYKLMTATEYNAEDLKQKERKKKDKDNSYIKGEKVLLLNATISEHDLKVQVKKIMKWIEKSCEVRIAINGDLEKGEQVYKTMESELKENARFIQKRSKGSDIKFQILPPRKSDDNKKPL